MGQKFCTPGSGATSAAQAKQTPEYNSLPATHTGAVLGCSWLGDSIVTCGDDNRVAVTELGKSGEVKVFEGHERSVNCVEGETQLQQQQNNNIYLARFCFYNK